MEESLTQATDLGLMPYHAEVHLRPVNLRTGLPTKSLPNNSTHTDFTDSEDQWRQSPTHNKLKPSSHSQLETVYEVHNIPKTLNTYDDNFLLQPVRQNGSKFNEEARRSGGSNLTQTGRNSELLMSEYSFHDDSSPNSASEQHDNSHKRRSDKSEIFYSRSSDSAPQRRSVTDIWPQNGEIKGRENGAGIRDLRSREVFSDNEDVRDREREGERVSRDKKQAMRSQSLEGLLIRENPLFTDSTEEEDREGRRLRHDYVPQVWISSSFSEICCNNFFCSRWEHWSRLPLQVTRTGRNSTRGSTYNQLLM